MSLPYSPSSELERLISDALMYGLVCAGDDRLSRMLPLAMKEGVDGREQASTNLAQTELAENIEAARRYVADSQVFRYAIVWDTRVRYKDEDFDALVVEAGERGAPHALQIYQRYMLRGLFKKKNRASGEPVVKRTDLLLR